MEKERLFTCSVAVRIKKSLLRTSTDNELFVNDATTSELFVSNFRERKYIARRVYCTE
jgi:hypothetical protein